MKVVVPYSRHAFATLIVLRGEGIEPRQVECTENDSYFNLMRDLWAEGETFVCVEHDVLPHPGAIQKLWECPEPWCGHTYYMRGRLGVVAFGCTKFSADLIAATPWIWDAVAHPIDFDGSMLPLDPMRTHWAVLDGIWRDLIDLNLPDLKPHLHDPPVVHMNELHHPYHRRGLDEAQPERQEVASGDFGRFHHWLDQRHIVQADPAEFQATLRAHQPQPQHQAQLHQPQPT